MIVYKFGGATTRTAQGLLALVAIVKRTQHAELKLLSKKRVAEIQGLVLVVSAIGHTTRHLLAAAEQSCSGLAALNELEQIYKEHLHLLGSLKLPETAASVIERNLWKITSQIAALLEGIAITHELSTRTRDAVAGSGERLAVALIQPLLRYSDIPTRHIPAHDIILTNEEFGRALPLIAETTAKAKRRILPVLRRGQVALIEGFVGATLEGIPTTMGSESSDLTATLLAMALQAKECVIWKSVAGIFNADPLWMPSAKLIPSLTFVESEEIGKRGARVLFPLAAEPLMHSANEIPLRISTAKAFKRSVIRNGTTIQRTLPMVHEPQPLALALEPKLLEIRFRTKSGVSGINAVSGHTSLQQKLETEKLMTSQVAEQKRRLALIHSRALYSVHAGDEIVAYFKEHEWSEIESLFDCASTNAAHIPVGALSLIVRIPEPIIDQNEVAAVKSQLLLKMLASLRRLHVHSTFTFERSIVLMLDDAQAEGALKKLHREFWE
jgi:aspartate kinase